LIVERVKSGLRNARAKGKKLGRPRRILNEQWISALRAQGLGIYLRPAKRSLRVKARL
jgi:DNA invertase Pin-like site-specific DNA recombinase